MNDHTTISTFQLFKMFPDNVRAAFWEAHPNASRERVRSMESCYVCDTRCAFVDYVDALSRNGDISEELASRVTL